MHGRLSALPSRSVPDPTKRRVLVADDESRIRDLVRSYLEAEGFEVETAANGVEALDVARERHPDLVLLDVMMPGIDGIEVLRRLRTESDVYVIMLTARADEVDTLIGLSVGADDYVTKPFSPRELVARIKTVLRRGRGGGHEQVPECLQFDGLTIDLARHEVVRDATTISLSALEFDLLVALARAPGRVFDDALNCCARCGDGISSVTSASSTCISGAFGEHSVTAPTRRRWSAPFEVSATSSSSRPDDALSPTRRPAVRVLRDRRCRRGRRVGRDLRAPPRPRCSTRAFASRARRATRRQNRTAHSPTRSGAPCRLRSR